MDRNKQVVRVLRQLDAEAAMLENLALLCDQFNDIVARTRANFREPVDMQPAQDRLAEFAQMSAPVINNRTRLLQEINSDRGPDNQISIRKFIQRSPEKIRSEMEKRRVGLVNKMHAIQTQMAGDSAVIFYSFDFYRRIVNGLVNCVAEEQNYDQEGKSAQQSSGKLIERAC